jgi:hypothetical protein
VNTGRLVEGLALQLERGSMKAGNVEPIEQ